jgi:hypothetical protein
LAHKPDHAAGGNLEGQLVQRDQIAKPPGQRIDGQCTHRLELRGIFDRGTAQPRSLAGSTFPPAGESSVVISELAQSTLYHRDGALIPRASVISLANASPRSWRAAGNEDGRSLLGEQPGGGASHPAVPTGDQSDLVFESHLTLRSRHPNTDRTFILV